MVQHGAPSGVEHRIAPCRRHTFVERAQGTRRKRIVAGIFGLAEQKANRHFMGLGIEIAASGDQGARILVEQTVYQQARLKSLAGR
jgi:hypothetical protein